MRNSLKYFLSFHIDNIIIVGYYVKYKNNKQRKDIWQE